MNQTAINTSTTTTAPEKGFFDKILDFFSKITFARIFKWCLTLGKIVAGAIAITALGHFVPELKDKIPTLFKISDSILIVFEWAISNILK